MVYINGIGFREIQDVGGSVNGKHIDVLVGTHSEALKCGVDNEDVWLLVKK
jgi:3D (Asp-Asp-Asp) domain-containing protein